MAFKAINDTASPNRLFPILLVLRVYPGIVKLDVLLLSVIHRVNAIKKATVEI